MQFAVPQFTEVEDRLIGSLTLKQFFVLLGTGGIVLFFWTLLGPSFLFFILSLPFAVTGVAAALGRYNGRPMFTYLLPFANFLVSTRVMVFKREPAIIVSKTQITKPKPQEIAPESLEPTESRLKKLAYLLDRKTEEQKEILTNDDKNIIRATSLPQINMNTLGVVMKKTKSNIVETAKKLDRTFVKSKSSEPEYKNVQKIVKSPSVRPNRGTTKKPAAIKKQEPKKFDPSSFLQK